MKQREGIHMKKRQFLPVLVLVLIFGLMVSASAAGFTDVSSDAYYADAVNWAVSKGITNGTSDTTFSPDDCCTRAQMVTFLWRFAGSPKAEGANPFTDVHSGDYYHDAVLWAYSKGVTRGIDATHFNPEGTVTRAEAVTFIWRGAGSPATGSTGNFSDLVPDQYYTDAVAWGHTNNIVKGTTATTFSPADPCTRAQIVTFLYRFSQLPAPEGRGEFAPVIIGEGLFRDTNKQMPDASTLNVTKYPVVLVHGHLGWGTYDQLNPYIP